ncbi:MAG: hypothetical protein GX307_03360 [Euryarchaeota archaeon]|jgi:rRNA small subunit pseudouridine methyltransferase Nep1|nr:hypothetical protein [Euryarchaeota archaeon]
MKLNLVLADAELELVPEMPDGAGEPGTRAPFQNIPVLDAYFHGNVICDLPESDRRGRPDILHKCLSLCQESILNREGMLRAYVHTRNDQVISLDSGTRIPPNYVEFLNEMGSLLMGHPVNGYNIASKTYSELIREMNADEIIALTPLGEEYDLIELFESHSSATLAVTIGAFPEGDYTSPVYEMADIKVSLGPRLLTVPSVVCEILAAGRRSGVPASYPSTSLEKE